MVDTEFLRSDELPGRTALGYFEIDGIWRTNVHHLPVRGSGDGGIYTTVADISALWKAFFAGRIVSASWVHEMVRPHSDDAGGKALRPRLLAARVDRRVMLVGSDTGVSFHTVHDPGTGLTHTVLSNTSDGAWPIARYLRDELATG